MGGGERERGRTYAAEEGTADLEEVAGAEDDTTLSSIYR